MDFTVSVVIPNYNNEKYIEQCVESVINQTYEELKQIIIVDDASTDHSRDILKRLEKKDDRIKNVFLDKNGKVSHARNEGLRYVTSQYVTFLDGDDSYFNENKLKNEMELIRQEYYRTMKSNVIAYSAMVRMSQNGNDIFKQPIIKEKLLIGSIYRKLLCKSTVENIMRDYCVRTELIKSLNGYNENRNFFEDFELILKLARTEKFCCTMQYGTAYRITERGLSNRPYDEQLQTIHEIALKEIEECPFLERTSLKAIRIIKYNARKYIKKLLKS